MHPYWATLIPRQAVPDTNKAIFDADAFEVIGTDEEKVASATAAVVCDVNHPDLPRIEGLCA
jgi:hypothetical protein